MPWTAKQHRLFEGVAHGSIPTTKSLTKAKAAKMAHEGIARRRGGRTGLAAGGVSQLPAGLSAANMTAGDPGIFGTGFSPSGATNAALNAASMAGQFIPGIGMISNLGNIGKGLYYGSQGDTSQPLNSSNSTQGSVANYLQNPGWLQNAADWFGNLFASNPQLPASAGDPMKGQSSDSSMATPGVAPTGAGNDTPSSGNTKSNPSTTSQTGTTNGGVSDAAINFFNFLHPSANASSAGKTGTNIPSLGDFSGGQGFGSGTSGGPVSSGSFSSGLPTGTVSVFDLPFDGLTGSGSVGASGASGTKRGGRVGLAAGGTGNNNSNLASPDQYDPFPFTNPAAATVPNEATGYVPTPVTASTGGTNGMAAAAGSGGGGSGGSSGSSGGLGGLASGLLGNSLGNLTAPIGSALSSLLTPAAGALGGLLGNGITDVANLAGSGLDWLGNTIGSAASDVASWLGFAEGGHVPAERTPDGRPVSHVLVAGGEHIIDAKKVAELGRRARMSGKSKKKTDIEAGHE